MQLQGHSAATCSLLFTSRDRWVIYHALYKLLEKERFYSILFRELNEVLKSSISKLRQPPKLSDKLNWAAKAR